MRALPSTRRAYMYVCNIHTCMCVCVCVCMCIYLSIYTHTFIHTCIYAHARAHTRTHGTCTCTAARVVQPHALHVIILSRILRNLSRRDALPRWAANHNHNSTTTLAPTSLQLRQCLPQKQRQIPRKQQSRDPGHPAGAWREGERVLY